MHDIRLIRENPAAFDAGLKSRGLDALSETLLDLDDKRRAAIAAAQAAQEKRNALSKEIGQAKKAKDEARAQALMAEVAALKESAADLDKAEKAASAALDKALAEIPNIPGDDVPVGADEHGNVERRDRRYRSERDPSYDLPDILRINSPLPRQHFELGEAMGLMDFETAAKLSGSRFVVLKGQIARLERALGQFMIDLHTSPNSDQTPLGESHGYTEVAPPLLVRDEVMFGTAQLPKFKDDQFVATSVVPEFADIDALIVAQIESLKADARSRTLPWEMIDDVERRNAADVEIRRLEGLRKTFGAGREQQYHWLIPTAEVPLTNLVRESILAEAELPLRFTALTPCFRAEAGAAGRDTRGMLRQHQFQKCELVSITTPEASADEHERMLACAEAVLKKLDLPFRVMTLCTGDMGFAAQKTYDIEVWLPGQKAYREISSCSVCGDFQARRMSARYRPKEGKGPRFVHTLNGSGTAVGRALIAVMENYQNEDGSVTIPSALRPYMGGLDRIEAKGNELNR